VSGPFPTVATFEGHEGETFSVRDSAPPVAMTLATVTTWGRPFRSGARQPFTLLFHGPLEPVLPQAVYHLDHEAVGAVDLFLVPLGPDQEAMRYEAVFA
jgi:hypothetical protein